MRFQNKCLFFATEVGQFNSDVFGCNEKKSYEIETKVSFQDFKNDFKKGYKHSKYRQTWSQNSSYDIPMFFYFAVPADIVEDCRLYLDMNAPEYGLINADEWSVVKRAKKLHEREPSTKLKFVLALRMGSELIRFHEALL